MLPSQKRLEACDGAILQPHDGLEQHLHFVAVERLPEIALHREMVAACPSAWSGGKPRCDRRPGVSHATWRSRSCGTPLRGRAAICGSWSAMPMEAVRKISRSRVGDRRRHGAPHHVGEGDDAIGLALREQDEGELVPGNAGQRILRPQQPAEAARTASAGWNRRPRSPTASLTALNWSMSSTRTVGPERIVLAAGQRRLQAGRRRVGGWAGRSGCHGPHRAAAAPRRSSASVTSDEGADDSASPRRRSR